MIAVLNDIAPEHVSIQHKAQDEIVEQIKYAALLSKATTLWKLLVTMWQGHRMSYRLVGLPALARFNRHDFRTSHAIINTSKASYEAIGPAGQAIAEAEGLDCHAQSIAIRKEG